MELESICISRNASPPTSERMPEHCLEESNTPNAIRRMYTSTAGTGVSSCGCVSNRPHLFAEIHGHRSAPIRCRFSRIERTGIASTIAFPSVDGDDWLISIRCHRMRKLPGRKVKILSLVEIWNLSIAHLTTVAH